MHLKSQTDTQVDIYVEYAIYVKNDAYASFCIAHLVESLFSFISVTFTYSTLWSSTSQARIDSSQYIVCHMPSSDIAKQK